MGRIVVPVTVDNTASPEHRIELRALVDTGAAFLTLPLAWRQKLGPFESEDSVVAELADGSEQIALVCGPVRFQIEGFRIALTMAAAERSVIGSFKSSAWT